MLQDNPAHYLTHVLRLGVGAAVALFNRTDGEWRAEIAEVKKKSVTSQVHAQTRPPEQGPDLWVAFAPIKGGRLETIIEKATELGAAELHPLLTQRTIVDKVNPERAESIAREAAEQCERTSWPQIHAPRKLAQWLGDFPTDRVLIYGDETGGGITVNEALNRVAPQLREPLALRATHEMHQRREDTERGQEPEPAMSPRSGVEASHSMCDLPEQTKDLILPSQD